MPVSAGHPVLHFILLILFVAIIAAYILRCTVLRPTVRRICGYFNAEHELTHMACAVFMVPMVVSALFSNPAVRTAVILLTVTGAAALLLQWILAKNKLRWGPIHAGMFLGTAIMYYAFDHSVMHFSTLYVLWWASGIFFLLFSSFYARQLFRAIGEPRLQRRGFRVQSELSHLIIGAAMLCMILWPAVFMAM